MFHYCSTDPDMEQRPKLCRYYGFTVPGWNTIQQMGLELEYETDRTWHSLFSLIVYPSGYVDRQPICTDTIIKHFDTRLG